MLRLLARKKLEEVGIPTYRTLISELAGKGGSRDNFGLTTFSYLRIFIFKMAIQELINCKFT